ncbi:hypothetical protein ThvES_00017670 [Thiovulum sp. ES]|nr:hypothetical protein ThvES_00017670 [Thiovulum sp. ES]
MADVSFTLSIEQIKQIKKAFKPVSVKDMSRITLTPNKVSFAIEDEGIFLNIDLSLADGTFNLNGNESFVFFYSKKHLFTTFDTVEKDLYIKVSDSDITFVIDETELNLSLMDIQIYLDITYTETMKTSIAGDLFSSLCSRLSANTSIGGIRPYMTVGKNFIYGTSTTFTSTKKGLEGFYPIEGQSGVSVPREFLKYMCNSTQFGQKVDFIYDEDKNLLIVRNGNVYYGVSIISTAFPDLSGYIDGEFEAYSKFSGKQLQSSLNKLLIPLLTTSDQADSKVFKFHMESSSSKAEISVLDNTNKISTDKWNMVQQKGDIEVYLNIYAFLSSIGAMNEQIEISILDSYIKIEDSLQNLILATSAD